jgi:dihydroorotate dehydrogenase electron transfer subunit
LGYVQGVNSTYHTAHVRDLRTVAPGTFVVATDQGARLDAAEPGQFVMLRPDWGRDPLLPRAFSILRRTGDRVEYLIKVMGRGTALLARLQPGDRISVLGPLGRPFPRPIPAPDAGVVTDVLVAGGVGLAPLLWYAEQVQRGGATRASLHFLYGARRAADLVLLEDVAATGADVILTTEDGSCPPGRGPETVVTGRVTAALERLLFSRPGSRSAPLRPETTRILACGPNPMMRAVAELAQAANVPCLVSLEGDMACGVGVCLGCPVPSVPSPRDPRPYRYCCIDGPVFDAREIVIP